MDFTKALQKEHSRRQATKIADYVGDNRARFKQLVEVYLGGPYRITQRAAWPLSTCVERHPALILPHLRRILDFVERPDVHDAVKRNTMRLLQFIEIPSKYQGRVTEICFDFLQQKRTPVAVKVFSMTVLGQIAQREPGLKNELRLVIEDQLPYASPGFISRARKVMKLLR